MVKIEAIKKQSIILSGNLMFCAPKGHVLVKCTVPADKPFDKPKEAARLLLYGVSGGYYPVQNITHNNDTLNIEIGFGSHCYVSEPDGVNVIHYFALPEDCKTLHPSDKQPRPF